jgi:hypothetical protein
MLTLLAGGSTNCLVDTGPINMPPTVQITDPAQALHRGDNVNFTATIHDPDQSSDSLNAPGTWVRTQTATRQRPVARRQAAERKQ